MAFFQTETKIALSFTRECKAISGVDGNQQGIQILLNHNYVFFPETEQEKFPVLYFKQC